MILVDDPIKEFEEMYLKKLYEFYAEDPHKPIRNSRIATEMGVSQASSSEMIQRLASKGILYHIPYRGATLTEDGLAAAARIKRRECLMEVFLVNMIDYKGDVEAAACRLEQFPFSSSFSCYDCCYGRSCYCGNYCSLFFLLLHLCR